MSDMMQYSPKLKKAMEEIKHILKRYDIAGVVVLHSPPIHSEFLLSVSPSYSCVKFTGDELRIKSKLADFGGDKEKQAEVLHDSVNMLIHLSDQTKMLHGNLYSLVKLLSEKMDIDKDDGGMSSHTTQNN